MSTELNTSLKALEQTYGRKALQAAMSELAPKRSAVPKDPDAAPKGEHLKEWRALIASVREEMIAADWTHPESGKPATYRDAMAEASLRKNADASPEDLAKKAAAKAKAAAAKAAKKDGKKAAVEATSDSASVKKADEAAATSDGSSAKRAGRPKMTDEQKAAAKAKREAAKAAESASDSGSVKMAADDASDGSSIKKAGRPKMTDEQKAAAKAKREAAKAAGGAGGAVVISDSESVKKVKPATSGSESVKKVKAATSDNESVKKVKPATSDSESVKKVKAATSDNESVKKVKPATSDSESVKKAGRPKMTEEQKAASATKRAAKKAEAELLAQSDALEATPVEIDGKPCVTIMGGYAYKYDNEEVGVYLGFLNADGKLDKSKPQPTGPE
jgi:hypothetical protein